MTDDRDGYLIDGPDTAPVTLILAHGAGAPMDSDAMTSLATTIAAHGIRVIRFEFNYMAQRRLTGKKRPPDRAPALIDRFRQAIEPWRDSGRLAIGGKSMGGRMASLLAADAPDGLAAVVCLGYPFHPPGKPDRPRTDHFARLTVPTLICQGERDPFGTRAEVTGYALPAPLTVAWLPDGDHDLKPRKASGRTKQDNWHACATTVARFLLTP